MTTISHLPLNTVAWFEPQLQHGTGALGCPTHVAGFGKRAEAVRRQLVALMGAVHEVSDAGGLEAYDVAVVSAGQIGPEDLASLLADIGPRTRPVLWLVADEAQEQQVLQSVDAAQDACRLQDTPEVALRRVQRLGAWMTARPLVALDDVDPLTGLLNRRGFGRVLRRTLNDLMPGDQMAVVLFDLDGFKALNDQYGHAAGDVALAAVARALESVVCRGDSLARLGGDEFVVLLSRRSAAELVADARVLLEVIAQVRPIALDDQEVDIEVRASAGLAMLRQGLTEPQVLRQADQAAWEAKAQGRNRLVHFELIHDAGEVGPEADLQRFQEVTRLFGDRMNRMLADVGRKLVESAKQHALVDPLTRARNRGFFNERLPFELERARAMGRPLAMALLDLDHFHDINVAFGWTTGDAVLQRFVQLATSHLRPTDWLARYGGEEFALVLPGTNLEDARAVAERLRASVEGTTFQAMDGRVVPVTLSIGVTVLTCDIADAIALSTKAGKACIQAKESGRNRVVALP